MSKVIGPRQAVKLPLAPSHTEGAAAMLSLSGPDPNDKVQMVALDDTKIEAKKIPAASLFKSCPRKPRGPKRKPKLGPNQRSLDDFLCVSANGPMGDQNGEDSQL